jgi:hypothetical protein
MAKDMLVILIGLLLLASPALAQDRVIGLLTLPEVFGGEECTPFTPQAVPLYSEPVAGAREAASIRAGKIAIVSPASGCGELDARVHRNGGATSELPMREYAYEAPAVIVLDRRNGWHKIRLSDGAAWVAPHVNHRFLPLAALFKDALTAITDQFTGQLQREPGGELTGERWKPYEPVRVLEVRQVGDRQWLHVEVLSHSPCDGNILIDPKAIASGWLPAHSASGEPTVWFYARGC